MLHKHDVAGVVSVTGAIAAWAPVLGEIVQLVAGLIGIISGAIYLYSFCKNNK